MQSKTYTNFAGIKTQFNPLGEPQNAFSVCDNFVYNKKYGALVRRGGTWSPSLWQGRSIVGLGGYVANLDSGSSAKVIEHPIQFGVDFALPYMAYFNLRYKSWRDLRAGYGYGPAYCVAGAPSFTQQDDTVCVATGRMGKLTSPSGQVERIGYTKNDTETSVAANGAGVLTSTGDGYRWVWTLYDSATGWESSPCQPNTALSLTAQQARITLAGHNCYAASGTDGRYMREGINKFRIYRTIATGEAPFLYVGETSVRNDTFDDNLADTSLGVAAPDFDDHDPPPDDSYICETYENALWVASGSTLSYSKPYNTSRVNLEYFSPLRLFSFPQRITGLKKFRSRLLVFFPPRFGIVEIRKQSNGTFISNEFHPTEGTNWHHSISTHGNYLTYWGETGPRLFGQSGLISDYEDDIADYLESLLADSYKTQVYCWSQFHEDTDQFIYGFSAAKETLGCVVAGTKELVKCVDSYYGSRIEWAINSYYPELNGGALGRPSKNYYYTFYENATSLGEWYLYKDGDPASAQYGGLTTSSDVDGANVLAGGDTTTPVSRIKVPSGSLATEGRYYLAYGDDGVLASQNAGHLFAIFDNINNIGKQNYWLCEAGATIPIIYRGDDNTNYAAAPTYRIYKDDSQTALSSGSLATFDSANLTHGNFDHWYVNIDTTGYADGRYTVFVTRNHNVDGVICRRAFQFVVRTVTATKLGDDFPLQHNLFEFSEKILIPLVPRPARGTSSSDLRQFDGTENFYIYPHGEGAAVAQGTITAWDSGTVANQYMLSYELPWETALPTGKYLAYIGENNNVANDPPNYGAQGYNFMVGYDPYEYYPDSPHFRTSAQSYRRGETIYLADPFSASTSVGAIENDQREKTRTQYWVYLDTTKVAAGSTVPVDWAGNPEARVAKINATFLQQGRHEVLWRRQFHGLDQDEWYLGEPFYIEDAPWGGPLKRNLVFGINPEKGLTGTFSWEFFPDLSPDLEGFTSGYVPRTKGLETSLLQDTLLIGTHWYGWGNVLFAFDKAEIVDLSSGIYGLTPYDITGTAITNRIDPTMSPEAFTSETLGTKRFYDIEFSGINSIAEGATVTYVRDKVEPHKSNTTWESFVGASDGARHAFTNGAARWVHIKIVDTQRTSGEPIFGGFKLRYLDHGSRERGPTD